jgi:hypothetical protein
LASSNIDGQVNYCFFVLGRAPDLLMTRFTQDDEVVPIQLKSLIIPLTKTWGTVQNLCLFM